MVRHWCEVFPQHDFSGKHCRFYFCHPSRHWQPPHPTPTLLNPPLHVINVATITRLCPKTNIPTVTNRLSHNPSTNSKKAHWSRSTASFSKSSSAWADVPKLHLSPNWLQCQTLPTWPYILKQFLTQINITTLIKATFYKYKKSAAEFSILIGQNLLTLNVSKCLK